MNVLQSTYDELKAECDALAIKAGRYDWLRISADISWNGWVTHSMLAATDAERAELDSAIDSAMASSGYEVNTRHGAGDAEAWRSIESAPRDGSYILVCNSHGSWIAKYQHFYPSGYRPSSPWASMMLNHDHIERPGRFDHPTHWRPLPAPPTDDAARAGERG